MLRSIMSLDSTAREKAMGLRELRYFLSVAETGNLDRAARTMNVTPSAISHQIRKLEDGIGTPLLLRHRRGMTPTRAGACLRDRLHTVMQLLAAPLDEAEPRALPETIKLGVPVETGGPLIVPLLKSCSLRWPHITLDIREGIGADMLEWIVHRYVDVAILCDSPLLPEVEVLPVMTENLGLVAPVHFRVAQDPQPLPVRELTGEPLILPSKQHWLRRRLDQATMQRGVELVPILQVDSTTLSKLMVRSGFGCTILPGTSVQAEVDQGTFTFRPIMKPSLVCTHSIAFHRVASNNLVAAFADLVFETMTALAHNGAWFGIQTITRKPFGGRTAGNGSLPIMEKRENQAADDKVLVSLL
jgi:LysR family transcriptional regulator, nitrogen assimilation regulatory protein